MKKVYFRRHHWADKEATIRVEREYKHLKETESGIQGAILDYLTRTHVFHYRNNTGAVKTENRFIRYGAKGSPDIVCVIQGRYVGLEVKTPDGRQSDSQREFGTNLIAAGGFYLLVHSVQDVIEAVDAVNQAIDYHKKGR